MEMAQASLGLRGICLNWVLRFGHFTGLWHFAEL